ncbi:MAG: methyltransferase domain-containing protein [Armatimonadia bacterium]|nr:methyltransferase domain-containing protein [Armatimonadia bacterium]
MEAPETEGEQKQWLAERAEEVLAGVPVEKGDVLVDFGCGAGTYALQAAKMVGRSGTVYAIDCDAERMEPVSSATRKNLDAIHGDGGTGIPLEDESCDVGLLYDVLQKLDDRRAVMREMHRVIRPNGVLSVYPMHLNPREIRAEVLSAGFRYRDDYAGLVLNFVRK